MSRDKPAEVRYYLDADILGLKILAKIRPDITFPGDRGDTINHRTRPECPIKSAATKDPVWIPIVAHEGWIVITRDSHIGQYRAEVSLVKEHGAKLVALAGKEAVTTWEQLEIVMRCWREIEALASKPGPMIWRATRSGLSELSLDDIDTDPPTVKTPRRPSPTAAGQGALPIP